jgi:hypothetical protein
MDTMEKASLERLASFLTKQLEDRDGIILRSSYTDPDDKFWLVCQIEKELEEVLEKLGVN